ncbi:hypothetical protein B0H17DRAFT_1133032 [Mycena rosella]|uniref:Uncharacterized protein n=1 Tax=Mycena rosella TaxID=1033263 RepID=A0AAD7DJ88_MYCRO|nr:hypothetical protein B0H17DRAFT_1133032 [Mycena rosella]
MRTNQIPASVPAFETSLVPVIVRKLGYSLNPEPEHHIRFRSPSTPNLDGGSANRRYEGRNYCYLSGTPHACEPEKLGTDGEFDKHDKIQLKTYEVCFRPVLSTPNSLNCSSHREIESLGYGFLNGTRTELIRMRYVVGKSGYKMIRRQTFGKRWGYPITLTALRPSVVTDTPWTHYVHVRLRSATFGYIRLLLATSGRHMVPKGAYLPILSLMSGFVSAPPKDHSAGAAHPIPMFVAGSTCRTTLQL